MNRKEAEDAKILYYRAAEQAKQDNLEAKVEEHTKKDEVISQAVFKSCSLKMTPWTLDNEVECEFSDEEIDNRKLLKQHIQYCPISKIDFNDFPYCLMNHIQINHVVKAVVNVLLNYQRRKTTRKVVSNVTIAINTLKD